MLSSFVKKLREVVYIDESGMVQPLPDWSVRAAAVGYWVRQSISPNSRILSFLVGPRRDYLGSFATLGAMVCSGEQYQPQLAWEQFIRLSNKQLVHWKDARKTYSGHVVGSEELMPGNTMIQVRVHKGTRKSESGALMWFSREQFERYSFTFDRPRSVRKVNTQLELLRLLSGSIKLGWLDDEGLEILYSGSISAFQESSKGVNLVIGQKQASMKELLMPERVAAHIVSKLKIEPAIKQAVSGASIVIQDGISAYRPDRESNILFLLNREELRDEVKEDLASVEHTFANTEELISSLGNEPSALEFCSFKQSLN
jgi:hypothetical protein